MRFLDKMTNLIFLNLLTLLLCIPVVTGGAAFTAMHYCTLKLARDQEGALFKQYFHSFKENFKQATAIWLITLALVAVFVADLFLMFQNPTKISSFVLGGIIVAFIWLLFIGSMVFPILAKFVNTVPGTLKAALVYSFRHFLSTLVITVVNLVPFALFFIGNIGLMLFPIIIVFCFSAPAYLAAKIYDKPFQEAEDAILAKTAAADDDKKDDDSSNDEPGQQPS